MGVCGSGPVRCYRSEIGNCDRLAFEGVEETDASVRQWVVNFGKRGCFIFGDIVEKLNCNGNLGFQSSFLVDYNRVIGIFVGLVKLWDTSVVAGLDSE